MDSKQHGAAWAVSLGGKHGQQTLAASMDSKQHGWVVESMGSQSISSGHGHRAASKDCYCAVCWTLVWAAWVVGYTLSSSACGRILAWADLSTEQGGQQVQAMSMSSILDREQREQRAS